MSAIAIDERRALNLGSGKAYDPAAVNLDVTSDTSPDVVHDLDVRPWPFPDDRFDRVEAIDVIEHLADTLGTMDELHRICRPGAEVKIVLPHFSSVNAFTDLTHRAFFAYKSFDYVTGEHAHDYYTRARFRMRRREIVFTQRPVNKLVRRFARRDPRRYEERYAWLFPAWFLVFELEVVKGPSPRP